MFIVAITLFLVVQIVTSEEDQPCRSTFSEDITGGVLQKNSTIQKDDTDFDPSNYYRQNGSIFSCACNNTELCIRKCCGPDEIYLSNDNKCLESKSNFSNFSLNLYNKERFLRPLNLENSSIIYGIFCKYGHFPLQPVYSDASYMDNYYLQSNGYLYLPNLGEPQVMYPPDKYCFENITIYQENDTINLFSVLLCSPPEEDKSVGNNAGMIISMPFLLATFIAYALLPDRNLHMKALMFYVITLMLSYLLLCIIQLSESAFSTGVCISLGYFCLYFFLVSFFWMNVICIDIWFAFSGLRGFSGSKKDAERKRFFMYCGYACGVPTLHVLIVYLIQRSIDEFSIFNPRIGMGQCFINKGYPELLYFYGPMAILITVNIIFFATTACRIRSIKRDTSMLKKEDSKRHSYENDKQTFNLYLKLLFAMGINWSMEIISWAVIWAGTVPDHVWYLTDFCNAIYGVFIFFIFVFKKSIWKLLKKRYYSFIGKPHLAHSMTMTNTRTTSYSTANSSVHDNPHGGATDTSTLTSEA